jgi:cytochrome c
MAMHYLRRMAIGLGLAYLTAACAGLATAAERGTAEEAKEMVAKAVALFNEKGEAAFDDINGGEKFRYKDLYVFVHSFGPDAKVVAYGGPAVKPPPLGRKSVDVKDADGKPIGQMFQELATSDGTWVDYRWMNPTTKMPEEKSSWVIRDGDYIFGCGIYK